MLHCRNRHFTIREMWELMDVIVAKKYHVMSHQNMKSHSTVRLGFHSQFTFVIFI